MKNILLVLFTMLTLSVSNLSAQDVKSPLAPQDKITVTPASPGENWSWVKPHWKWDGGEYEWKKGMYVQTKVGYSWMDGKWERDKKSGWWKFSDGYWQKESESTSVEIETRNGEGAKTSNQKKGGTQKFYIKTGSSK